MCTYVVIIYSLLKPAFHVKISHILLRIDLKHQFLLGASTPSPHGDALPRPCKGTFAAIMTPAVSFSSNFLTTEWKACYMSASPSTIMSSSHYPPPLLTPPSYSLKLRHRNICSFTPISDFKQIYGISNHVHAFCIFKIYLAVFSFSFWE